MKRTLKTISIWIGTLCFILIVFPGAFAQSSLNTLGGNTNDAGGSVNFSLGQLFYQTNSGTTGSAAEGVQHPFELFGSSVPATYILLDRVIGTGELLCFDARQSITVAGGEGSVVIQPNAVVDFIAGQSIRFLPGFYAQAGSWVSARITTTGTFCGQPIAPVVMQTENPPEKTVESINPDPFAPEGNSLCSVKLFPNPNHGCFVLEVSGFDKEKRVVVHNATGRIVFRASGLYDPDISLCLPFLKEGLYYLSVADGRVVQTVKMLVD